MPSFTPKLPRHVLIVGGGLAGPCLALALARVSIRSTIFEIRSARPESGGSLTLGPNALQVLDRYAGIYPAVRDAGFTYTRMGAYTDDGEKLGDIVVGLEGEGGKEGGGASYPAVRIMRTKLHHILINACAQTNGLIQIKWAAELSGIEEDEGGVTARFKDGEIFKGLNMTFLSPLPTLAPLTRDQGFPFSFLGDLLVGADGIHSKVRSHVLGERDPKPISNGLCIVYGFLPASSVVVPDGGLTFPAFLFTRSGLFMTIPVDREAKTLAWVINQPVTGERTRYEWRELERSGQAARDAKAGYNTVRTQPVRSLLDRADDKDARIWPTYSLPDIPTWHTSHVCLIGDAAHGLPPNGLGSGLAFEDAAILSLLLGRRLGETTSSSSSSASSYEELFSQFETIRRPRIDGLRESSKTGAAFKAETGPVLWWLKRWAFRGFFAFNGGVLHHTKESVYDVDAVDLDAAKGRGG